MRKTICTFLTLAVVFGLTACFYDPDKLEKKHQKEHEEKCEKI